MTWSALPHRPGDRAHAVTLHHARQIVSFYEHFALQDNYSTYRLTGRRYREQPVRRWGLAAYRLLCRREGYT